MKGIFIFLNIAYGMCVYDDLTLPPQKIFKNWFQISFVGDHSSKQPIQPPSDWRNLTFQLIGVLYNVTEGIQFTADNGTNISERIVYYALYKIKMELEISIVWWGPPWILHMGF